METINKQRMAKLVIHLLEHAIGERGVRPRKNTEIHFDMSTFAFSEWASPGWLTPDKVVECGTSCCLAGYAPFVFRNLRGCEDWKQVLAWLTGGCGGRADAETPFLFGGSWGNDVKHAAARVLYVLKDMSLNGSKDPYRRTYPVFGEPSSQLNRLMRTSVEEMILELAAYLKPTNKP